MYYCPMFKNTPTASLEVILSQRPLYLDFEGVALRNYTRLKDEVMSKWPGYSETNRFEVGHLYIGKDV